MTIKESQFLIGTTAAVYLLMYARQYNGDPISIPYRYNGRTYYEDFDPEEHAVLSQFLIGTTAAIKKWLYFRLLELSQFLIGTTAAFIQAQVPVSHRQVSIPYRYNGRTSKRRNYSWQASIQVSIPYRYNGRNVVYIDPVNRVKSQFLIGTTAAILRRKKMRKVVKSIGSQFLIGTTAAITERSFAYGTSYLWSQFLIGTTAACLKYREDFMEFYRLNSL